MEVNVNAAMWCTRAFLPGMIAKGSGHIVMMASAAGLLGVPGMAAYAASKHAVIGLAESIRLELRRQGHSAIGLSIVCPGFVKTGMFEGVKPPLLTPWLGAEAIADKIYEGVVKDRPYIREPFMIKLIPALKGFTTPGIYVVVILIFENGDRLGDVARHRRFEKIVDSRLVGDAEHQPQILAAIAPPAECAAHRRSPDRARTTHRAPSTSAARAIMASASGSMATPSALQTPSR